MDMDGERDGPPEEGSGRFFLLAWHIGSALQQQSSIQPGDGADSD